MASTDTDLNSLASSTANRLRLIQIDFADQPPQTRQEYLADEIQRVVNSLVPTDREPFLEALRDRFPTWESSGGFVSRAQQEPQSGRGATELKELEDPSFLVTKLVELSSKLSELQKRALADRLKSAGFLPSHAGDGSLPSDVKQELALRLKLLDDQGLDPQRVSALASKLIEFSLSLDQLAWRIWKTVAPRSSYRGSANLQRLFKQFLTGEAEVNKTQVGNELERLRTLNAALISAVSRAARQFAQTHAATFSPAEIEALVKMEGSGGLLKSHEYKCWHKYLELSESLEVTAIENEIMKALAKSAEDLMGV